DRVEDRDDRGGPSDEARARVAPPRQLRTLPRLRRGMWAEDGVGDCVDVLSFMGHCTLPCPPMRASNAPANAPTPAARKPGPADNINSSGHRLWDVGSWMPSTTTRANTAAGTAAPAMSAVSQARVPRKARQANEIPATTIRPQPQM